MGDVLDIFTPLERMIAGDKEQSLIEQILDPGALLTGEDQSKKNLQDAQLEAQQVQLEIAREQNAKFKEQYLPLQGALIAEATRNPDEQFYSDVKPMYDRNAEHIATTALSGLSPAQKKIAESTMRRLNDKAASDAYKAVLTETPSKLESLASPVRGQPSMAIGSISKGGSLSGSLADMYLRQDQQTMDSMSQLGQGVGSALFGKGGPLSSRTNTAPASNISGGWVSSQNAYNDWNL